MSGTASPFVLAFGDSLTAGYGLASADAFPAQLQTLLRAHAPGAFVQNAGMSGDTSASGRARLPGTLSRLRVKPDLAILELGANDLLRAIAPERMRDNLDAMLGEFEACGIRVLLTGMVAPPFLGAAFAERYNGVFTGLAAKHRVPLYPFFLDGVVGDPALTLADRIHPNARAIGIVARRILPHVATALGIAGARAAA